MGDKTAVDSNVSSSKSPDRSTNIHRDISLRTAASASDLQHSTSTTPGVPNVETSHFIKLVQGYSLAGAFFLLLFAVVSVVVGNYFAAFLFFCLIVAVGVCCFYGCTRRDWRFVLGLLVIGMVIMSYLAARGVLAIVMTVIGAYMTDEELRGLGFSGRAWMIASRITEALLCFCLSIYWGINGWYCEKVVRILLEERASATSRDANVLGNPVHDSTHQTIAVTAPEVFERLPPQTS